LARIEDRVRRLAEEICASMGCTVEDVDLQGSARKPTLRVIIDREEGVRLADCEALSRELSAVLDVEDLFPGPYNLEVSSPGLDRPLKRPEDFRKQVGKLVRLVTKKPLTGDQTFFIGRLAEAGQDDFVLKIGEQEFRVSYDAVKRARLEVEI
jgi:ribosome maturation factor RimP